MCSFFCNQISFLQYQKILSNIINRWSFDANKLELFGWTVSVIEEQLFADLDVSISVHADTVVAIDQNHFGVAVRVYRMVSKTDLVALALGVHYVVTV